jgi:hypothetical protein
MSAIRSRKFSNASTLLNVTRSGGTAACGLPADASFST